MVRIIEQSENSLEVKITPPRVLAWGLIVVGCFLLWLCSEKEIIEFSKDDRGVVSCTIRKSRLGISYSPKVLRDVTEAGVERSGSARNNSDSYRVALVTQERTYPVTDGFSSSWVGPREMARAINGFIGDPKQRTGRFESSWSRWILILLLVPLLGAALLRSGSRIRIDKGRNEATVVRSLPVWHQRRELRLDEIQEFRVLQRRHQANRESLVYCPGAVLADGTEFPLMFFWSSSQRAARDLVGILENFRSGTVQSAV